MSPGGQGGLADPTQQHQYSPAALAVPPLASCPNHQTSPTWSPPGGRDLRTRSGCGIRPCRARGLPDSHRRRNATPRAAPPTGLSQGQPRHTPGNLGQDLLDADHELLVLGRVPLDGSVQLGHVEVQRAECGRLAGAWGRQGTVSQPGAGVAVAGAPGNRGQRIGVFKGGVLGRGPWRVSVGSGEGSGRLDLRVKVRCERRWG